MTNTDPRIEYYARRLFNLESIGEWDDLDPRDVDDYMQRAADGLRRFDDALDVPLLRGSPLLGEK